MGEEKPAAGEEEMEEEEDGGENDDEEEDDDDESTMHRLCPTYAQDINSPLRHVRTRIYFTSESHVHSLVNVLRFAHLKYGFEQEEKERKLHEAEERALAAAEGGAEEQTAAATDEHLSSSAPPPPSPTPPPQMPFSSHPPLLSPEAIGESICFLFGGKDEREEKEKVKNQRRRKGGKLTLFCFRLSTFPQNHHQNKQTNKKQPACGKTPRSSTT